MFQSYLLSKNSSKGNRGQSILESEYTNYINPQFVSQTLILFEFLIYNW